MTETVTIQTGDTIVDEKLTDFCNAIESNDLQKCKDLISELFKLSMTNQPLAKWITIPANLSYIQNLLSTTFNIDHRQFQLKARVASRHRRAILFIKTMVIALDKVQDEHP